MNEIQTITTITLPMWQMIVLLIGFFGAVWAGAKLLVVQFEKRLEVQFEAQEQARTQGQKHWDDRFTLIEKTARNAETGLLSLRAELPNQYVRREDWIRGWAVIEAKQDTHAERLMGLANGVGRLEERLAQYLSNKEK